MNLIYNRSGIRAVGILLNNYRDFGRILLTLLLIIAMSPVYAQVPTITNVSPLSGPIGTSVTITGTNFSTTAANNTVLFGAVKATVTAASATVLTVTVPSGATEHPVSVSVNGLMVVSYFVFHVTFSGGTLEMGNPVSFTAGSLPKTVVIADVDGDGKPDLLTVNNGSNTVSVFRNVSGTGTITAASFAGKVDLATEAGPVGLAVGDLDGDNKPDVVAVSTSAARLSVFKNTSTSGAVSFATRINVTTVASPRGVALGDLDADGKPELVTVAGNNVYIFKNLATTGTIDNASFPTSTSFPVNNSPEFVLVDDVDRDRKLDLVISSNSTMGTTVMRNTYSGAAFSFAVKVNVAAGTGVNGNIILTDLDGDGKRDMVQSSAGSSLFYVSRNISTNGFLVEFEPHFTVETSIDDLSWVAAGDVDGDGKPDLVLGSTANRILTFKNQASFGFLDRTSLADEPVEYTLGIPATDVSSVAVGDLNADSKPDILASHNLGSELLVLENGVISTPTLPQTITFDPIASPKSYGTVFDLVATASSGLTVTFTSSDPSVITVSGSSATVVGIGTATITASQSGDLVYSPATPVDRPVTTTKANQTITFGAIATKFVDDADFTLNATSSSGLAVSYSSSNTAVATVTGNLVQIVGAGTSTITASQAGNTNYNAASSIQQVLTVVKREQTITFGAIATKSVDDADFTLNATSSSGLAVSYSSSNTAVATVTGNLVNIVGAGTSTITASQAGNANYNAASSIQQVLTVVKGEQTITFGAIATKFVDDADFTLNATSSSGLTVSYSSSNTAVATVTGNSVNIVGVGTSTITASQAGNANYNAASPKQQVLTVVKREQTITFDAIATKFADDADFTLNATSSSGLTVSYSSSNTAVATVTGNLVNIVGIGTSTITASQAGNANYNAASSKQQVLTVVKREQAITFEAIATKHIGDADFTLNATASSGLPVSYTSSNALVATVSGNTVHIVAEGTSTITASQDGNTVFNAAPPVAQTLIVAAVVGTEYDVSHMVSIYPNPTTDRVKIITSLFNKHSDIEVALVDMYGRVVVRESHRVNSDNEVNLSISSLDDGLYIVHVTQGVLEFRNRLVKVK